METVLNRNIVKHAFLDEALQEIEVLRKRERRVLPALREPASLLP